MALANTTLASAMGISDTVAVVTASTGLVARAMIRVDGETMQIASNYSTGVQGTKVPVLRGQNGTANQTHESGAKFNSALASDAEWGSQAPQTDTQYPIMAPPLVRLSITTTPTTLTLPNPGQNTLVMLNGTSTIALTVPVPTEAMDGNLLYIASNGAAAHTVTFTGGLSGASSNYDVITINATAPVLLGPFMAVQSLWQLAVAVPLAGTVTNVTATIA